MGATEAHLGPADEERGEEGKVFRPYLPTFPQLTRLDYTQSPPKDPAISPDHYARFKIQPIRFLVENYGATVMVAHIIPYIMRWDAKNGVQDLKKARRFLDMMIRFVEGDPDWWKDPDANG